MGSTEDSAQSGEGPTVSGVAPACEVHDDSPPAYDALPAYTEIGSEPKSAVAFAAIAAAEMTEKKSPPDDITAAFCSLNLTNEPLTLPNPETCLAHLKLLYAFRSLREYVGYTDGIWGIHNPDQNSKEPEATEETMSRLREKRWAVYLARAVDRYEAWWESLGGTELTMADLEVEGRVVYEKFPYGGPGDSMVWDKDILVPLDVLMVWHTHMLNPRAYLEDCIRQGRRALWLGGIPWATVNAAIDTSFVYSVPPVAKAHWEMETHLPWENTACPMTKSIACPRCHESLDVNWTSWKRGATQPTDEDFIGGIGYGDGNFSTVCPAEGCSYLITKDALCVAKWVRDVNKLLKAMVPMPGTVLSLPKGIPIIGDSKSDRHHLFPNRLIRKLNPRRFLDFFDDREPATIARVRSVISGMIMLDLRSMDDTSDLSRGSTGNLILRPHSRMAVRKMLSRYDGNHSILAIDLVAAVSRQSVFIDKMFKLDWLHSPAATPTMSRLITKYTRFIDIMAQYPNEMTVPTLDVDLAWPRRS